MAGRVLPGPFERVDDPLYPRVALREALANALCHRDYSIGGGSVAVAAYDDRLEITSSGTLLFGLTPAALYAAHESLPWNPLVARAFYRRGVIESWGRGTQKMAELAEKAGLPRPDIEDANGCVTVRFRPSRYVPPRRIAHALTERQRAILAVLTESEVPLALHELIEKLPQGMPTADIRNIRRELQLLKEFDLAAITGRGAGARWRLSSPK